MWQCDSVLFGYDSDSVTVWGCDSALFVPGGYDSDVEREKNMDYQSKIYYAPVRDSGGQLKPHLLEDKTSEHLSTQL